MIHSVGILTDYSLKGHSVHNADDSRPELLSLLDILSLKSVTGPSYNNKNWLNWSHSHKYPVTMWSVYLLIFLPVLSYIHLSIHNNVIYINTLVYIEHSLRVRYLMKYFTHKYYT